MPTDDFVPEPTAHEIKKRFVNFIAFAVTARRRNTPEWREMLTTEATAAANFIGYSGRYVLNNDLISWSDE